MSLDECNKKAISMTRLLSTVMVATALLLVTGSANAAAPGITGPNFDLTARAAFITQPDGATIYSWGYGCNQPQVLTLLPLECRGRRAPPCKSRVPR